MADTWLKCSECRTEIDFGDVHWVCSVSTCNRNRMRLVFCSVECWDSHLSTVRHRDAAAIEARAPSQVEWQRQRQQAADAVAAPASGSGPGLPPSPPVAAAAPGAPVRRIVGESPSGAAPSAPSSGAGGVTPATVAERDMLIVVSKLKKYIKDRSGFNCSDAVAEVLGDHVRAIADESIRAAARDERKTVLDRDVPRARR